MEGEGGAFVSLDEVVTRIFNKPSYIKTYKMNKPHPYYDRPSKQTSFNIAVICVVCIIVMLIGISILEIVKKVSDDRNDFDNTSIKINKDIPIDTLYNRQEQVEGRYDDLTSIFTSKRILRALNEQRASNKNNEIV